MKQSNYTYSPAEKNLYLLGLAGQNILYGIITSSFAYYLQFTLLIPAAVAGMVLSISKIFDAVKDPFIGAWINRKAGRYGKLRTYLLYLPVPTALATILCFVNGIYDLSAGAGVRNICIISAAFVSSIIWQILFAMGDIPMTGYPSVITKSERDRTKLLALRPIGSIACSLCILIVQPIAFSISDRLGGTTRDEQKAFLLTVAGLSVLGGALFQLTAVKSKERVFAADCIQKNQFAYFISNPILRKIWISGILGSLKATPGIVMTPLVSFYFASKDPALSLLYTALLGSGSFIGMLISMAIIPKLTQKFSNRTIYIYSNLLNVLPNLLLFGIYLLFPQNMTDALPLLLLFLLLSASGICISISQTVQTLIISDAVDYEEKRSATRPDALFFSCQTFIIKISSGLSSLAASAGYAVIHFSSRQTEQLNQLIANGGIPRLEADYAPFMTLLFFLSTIPVAVSSALSVLPFIKRNKD